MTPVQVCFVKAEFHRWKNFVGPLPERTEKRRKEVKPTTRQATETQARPTELAEAEAEGETGAR